MWYTCHPWIRTIRARQGEGALDKRFSSRSFRSFTDLARLESLKVPRRPHLINGQPSPYRFELVSRSKSLIAAESETLAIFHSRIFPRSIDNCFFFFIDNSSNAKILLSLFEISEKHLEPTLSFQIVLSLFDRYVSTIHVHSERRTNYYTLCNKKLLDGYSVARDTESRRVNLHTLSILYSY